MELDLLGDEKYHEEIKSQLERMVQMFASAVAELHYRYPDQGLSDSDSIQVIVDMAADSIRDRI